MFNPNVEVKKQKSIKNNYIKLLISAQYRK